VGGRPPATWRKRNQLVQFFGQAGFCVCIALKVAGCYNDYTNLLLKGRKDLRGIIVPNKAEDAGGLTPGKDDNAVWRNKTRKAFDDLMED